MKSLNLVQFRGGRTCRGSAGGRRGAAGDGADDLGASDELIAFKDEGEQEEERGRGGGRDLDDVKSLVNESEANNSGSETEADHRTRSGSELEGRTSQNQLLQQAVRKQQHGGLFQPSPYLGYPFFMIPDIGNLCGPYGALTASGRTYLPFQWPLLDLPGTSALRDTAATHLSNSVPVVQHPHVTPLHPLLSYSPEAFSPQRASPGFSPDAGVSRSPHTACYPVSPGGVAQITHPLSWLQGQSLYPLPGGLSPAALAMNSSVSSLMSGGFSPRLVTPLPPRSSSTAAVEVKQEPGESSRQPAGKAAGGARGSRETRRTRREEDRKPHIKKPLNAFMLYMREERARVVRECNVKESATINQILGQRWHSLTKEEQAKYYELARKERLAHLKQYPGWSARDNYGEEEEKRGGWSQTELDAVAPHHDFPPQPKRPAPGGRPAPRRPRRPPVTQPPAVSHLTHTHLSQASPASSLDSPATPTTALASPAAPAPTHTEHTHSSPFGPMSPYGEQLQPLSLTTKPHRTAPPLRPPSSSPHAASSRTPPPPPPPFLVPLLPPSTNQQPAPTVPYLSRCL
ncbi:LOW QUALITY PROTEIN: transcription factor 7-like 1-B [Salarias fasciatus]|uniref:LOW QUALITY PROTEIN: transcription factor 7-like 1-B n=1 Tax=Salarias fasciatus TaxID=181472 RepID=UPI001176FDC8|nr:LOW QUALITY PROTEIN: transcription factor 7-like 1-B [Salarias fasciatus]